LLVSVLGCGRVALDTNDRAISGAGGAGLGGSTASTSSGGSGGDGNTPTSGTSSSGAGGAWTTGTGGGSASTWTTGTGSTTSGMGGGPTCASFGDPCTECMASECPPTYCGCVENDDCLELIQCNKGCGDDACQESCLSQHADGVSAAILVGDCAATTCKPSCPSSEGELTPCEVCLYTNCSSAANACLSQPVCLDLWSCLAGCSNLDLACHKGCYAQYEDGVAPLQALFECSDQSCDGACP
jgi:hypothetical protein